MKWWCEDMEHNARIIEAENPLEAAQEFGRLHSDFPGEIKVEQVYPDDQFDSFILFSATDDLGYNCDDYMVSPHNE